MDEQGLVVQPAVDRVIPAGLAGQDQLRAAAGALRHGYPALFVVGVALCQGEGQAFSIGAETGAAQETETGEAGWRLDGGLFPFHCVSAKFNMTKSLDNVIIYLILLSVLCMGVMKGE